MNTVRRSRPNFSCPRRVAVGVLSLTTSFAILAGATFPAVAALPTRTTKTPAPVSAAAAKTAASPASAPAALAAVAGTRKTTSPANTPATVATVVGTTTTAGDAPVALAAVAGSPKTASPASAPAAVAAVGKTQTTATTAVSSSDAEAAAMQARVERLTREVVPLVKPYDIGVPIIDNRSGTRWSYRGARANSQASLVKLGTSVGMFLTAYRQGRSVTAQERTWMKRALQVSDNAAQSALWRRIGGHDGYARAMRQMGLSAATKPVAGRGWGVSLSTPNDQVKLMTALLEGEAPLKAADAKWLVSTMRGVSASQTWGAAPFGRDAGRVIEVKNGWSPFRPSNRWRLASLGHVKDSRHDYTIAIMSNGWSSSGAGIPKLDAVGWQVYRILGY